MKSPAVSVIVPAYNAAGTLGRALISVVEQSFTDWELLVIDDKSTDETASICRQYCMLDSRIRYLCSPFNGGPAHARNVALEHAKGEWITLLDADDWYEPERLSTLLKAAASQESQIVADNQIFMNAEFNESKGLLTESGSSDFLTLSVSDFFEGDVIRRYSRNLGLLKPLVRRELIEQHSIRYDDRKRAALGEDFYFLLECLVHAKVLVYVTEPLYNYRVDGLLNISKQLKLESLFNWKSMHERYAISLAGKFQQSECRHMQNRGVQIDRYIQFRMLVDPIKQGNIAQFMLRFLKHPVRSTQLLVSDLIADPGAILLTATYLKLNFKQAVGRGYSRCTKWLSAKDLKKPS
ncbi:glycosyltransferase family 2 protein [Alteromonas aestuariivivens]|uniref:Glycosyltransferase family 2 protein n=1 Tax=Alteromonas aestuariivivens TaxID=1938339 RepID=A0A3D8MC02_9ALTE|nr:glycosyltransferase family 2 protein [Alteromonas aestuariivivens]RDV27972.1 glycosyltransferase family 2 protein [Alteromonas aestuariivivens]